MSLPASLTSKEPVAADDDAPDAKDLDIVTEEPEKVSEESDGDNSKAPLATDDSSTAADTDEGDEPAETKTSRWRRIRQVGHGRLTRRVYVIILAIVAVAALILAGWFGREWKSQRDTEQAAAAALAVAHDYAVTLTSVSADSIDNDFMAVLDGATGEFKDMYSKSSSQLRQLLIDNKAQAQGKVVASGISSASPTEVTVLLFVDQSVRNASTPQPRIDRSRVTITMKLVDGRWLADKVDLP